MHHRATDRPAPIAIVDGVDLDDSSVWEQQAWGSDGPPQILGHVSKAFDEGAYGVRDLSSATPPRISAADEAADSIPRAQDQKIGGGRKKVAVVVRDRGTSLTGGAGVTPRRPAQGTEPSDYAATGYASQSYKAPLLKPKPSDDNIEPMPLGN